MDRGPYEHVAESFEFSGMAYETLLDFQFADSLDIAKHTTPFKLFRVAVADYKNNDPPCVLLEYWQYRVDYYFLIDRLSMSLDEFLEFRYTLHRNRDLQDYSSYKGDSEICFHFASEVQEMTITKDMQTMTLPFALATQLRMVIDDKYLPPAGYYDLDDDDDLPDLFDFDSL